jgi:hypothetical protein
MLPHDIIKIRPRTSLKALKEKRQVAAKARLFMHTIRKGGIRMREKGKV